MNGQTVPSTVLQPFSVIVSVLALISLFPWLIAAGVSVMLFDAPGSTGSFFTQLVFVSIWSHPVAVVLGTIIIFGNKAREVQRYVIGIGVTFAPVVLGFASLVAIDLFCGGRLSC